MEMMADRAWKDEARRNYVLERVEVHGSCYTLGFDGGVCCGLDKSDLVIPQVGDRLTLWGPGGLGSVIRGQAINDVVVWYRSEEEDRAHHIEQQRQRDEKRRADYEAAKPRHDAMIATLPEVFQQRLAGYRERNPDFGWKFEAYELMCCVDAVKIAEACQDVKGVVAFYKLEWHQHGMAVPGLDAGHSGNTLGMACMLARVYLEQPDMIPKVHGAMSPLVGSEEYGDWCHSAEATAERQSATE